MENLLLSSSPQVAALNPEVLRLPVKPSLANYFEVGFTKEVASVLRAEVNYFRRSANNFADDDLLLNTTVSFPIAFRKASIYGAEAKLDLPAWHRLSGTASYSYMVGTAYLAVTGGLFLGTDATNALGQTSGRFPISQDQRNTLRVRGRYQFTARISASLGANYSSGLPVEFNGTPADALAQYGQSILDRVDFAKGRVRPNLSVDVSGAAELWKHKKKSVRLQVGVENLNNRLNLINFAGLFSGNAVAMPRSYDGRLSLSF
jgi:outer membrane receptor for Fe3+-dicitrate